MSQENVEIARRLFELFNERDFDVFWSLIDEHVEWHSRVDEPDADDYYGQESFRRYLDGWLETFPDVRLEFPGESVDLGDQVIIPTHLVGTARATGIEVREPYSFLLKIAGHKIVLAREFRNNDDALEYLGLAE